MYFQLIVNVMDGTMNVYFVWFVTSLLHVAQCFDVPEISHWVLSVILCEPIDSSHSLYNHEQLWDPGVMWSRAEFTGLKMSVIKIFKFQVCLSMCVFGWATRVAHHDGWFFSCGEGRVVFMFKEVGFPLSHSLQLSLEVHFYPTNVYLMHSFLYNNDSSFIIITVQNGKK